MPVFWFSNLRFKNKLNFYKAFNSNLLADDDGCFNTILLLIVVTCSSIVMGISRLVDLVHKLTSICSKKHENFMFPIDRSKYSKLHIQLLNVLNNSNNCFKSCVFFGCNITLCR